MDKQELIEETLHLMEKSLQNKIHGVHTDFDRGVISAIEKAMRLINQLDEPQKVKIPPFVAEYLEKCKEEGLSLSMALEFSDDTDEGDAMKWLYDNRKIMNDQHVYLFVRAWVDGYANVDISRMEMKHGREVVVRALEEYLRESGMNVVSN